MVLWGTSIRICLVASGDFGWHAQLANGERRWQISRHPSPSGTSTLRGMVRSWQQSLRFQIRTSRTFARRGSVSKTHGRSCKSVCMKNPAFERVDLPDVAPPEAALLAVHEATAPRSGGNSQARAAGETA